MTRKRNGTVKTAAINSCPSIVKKTPNIPQKINDTIIVTTPFVCRYTRFWLSSVRDYTTENNNVNLSLFYSCLLFVVEAMGL